MRAPPRFSGYVRLWWWQAWCLPLPVVAARSGYFFGGVSPYFHLIFVAHSLSLNRSCSLFFLAAVRLIVPGVLLFRLLLFRRWILPLCLIA